MRHADTLERGATAFQMKLSAPGHDSYNARTGEHDDLLLAAGSLMLTGVHDAEQMLQAFRFGAAAYLVKDGGTDAVLRAIRAVYHGDGALDPATTQQLISAYRVRQTPARPDDGLTPAEPLALKLLTRGLSNRHLAAELGVSVRTVATHVRHILDKLGVQNRLQAALYPREHGLTA